MPLRVADRTLGTRAEQLHGRIRGQTINRQNDAVVKDNLVCMVEMSLLNPAREGLAGIEGD
eukprot:5157692-Lingulodinium_polyedra.AAC.1